jgi:hypothetical protein
MKTMDEAFGSSYYELENTEPKAVDDQVTVKATPEVERVDPEELENAYLKDPITFNSINKATQAIMAAGYSFKCKDPAAKSYFDRFVENIGKIGEDITFDEFLYSVFQYQMIYGNAFAEIVWNKNMSKIVDLVILDPKRIDYAKDSQGRIVLDNYGKTVGYTQIVPFGVEVENKGDKIPAKYQDIVKLNNNQIFLSPKRICHFKLYTYGDRFYGIGLIEPAYKSIVRKMNIEVAQTNSIDARGTFPLIDYIGDSMHEPTAQMIDNALIKLKDFRHNRYFAFPYWHKVEPLEIKGSDIVENTLRYLRENQSASLGIPLAFGIGSGEATNRATLTNQQQFMEFTLNDIVNKTISTIEKYIFSAICKTEGLSEYPKIVWGNIKAEEINDKSKRLVSYVEKGILPAEKVTPYAIGSEDLN